MCLSQKRPAAQHRTWNCKVLLRATTSGLDRPVSGVVAQRTRQTPQLEATRLDIWLWVKNGYPKWNPGKWNQGLKPAVRFLVVKF